MITTAPQAVTACAVLHDLQAMPPATRLRLAHAMIASLDTLEDRKADRARVATLLSFWWAVANLAINDLDANAPRSPFDVDLVRRYRHDTATAAFALNATTLFDVIPFDLPALATRH